MPDGSVALEVAVRMPEDAAVIIGQAPFVKTVEDVHEALAGAHPALRCGLAFCEASGACLVRRSGNEPELVDAASMAARAIGAGHSVTGRGRGVIGVVDGSPPVGVEADADIVERHDLLRTLGYTL